LGLTGCGTPSPCSHDPPQPSETTSTAVLSGWRSPGPKPTAIPEGSSLSSPLVASPPHLPQPQAANSAAPLAQALQARASASPTSRGITMASAHPGGRAQLCPPAPLHPAKDAPQSLPPAGHPSVPCPGGITDALMFFPTAAIIINTARWVGRRGRTSDSATGWHQPGNLHPAAGRCGLAAVPGIDAGGSGGAELIVPQPSRGQQRPRDQCGVKEIQLRTRGFDSFLPQERLGFMDFW